MTVMAWQFRPQRIAQVDCVPASPGDERLDGWWARYDPVPGFSRASRAVGCTVVDWRLVSGRCPAFFMAVSFMT